MRRSSEGVHNRCASCILACAAAKSATNIGHSLPVVSALAAATRSPLPRFSIIEHRAACVDDALVECHGLVEIGIVGVMTAESNVSEISHRARTFLVVPVG